MNKYTKLRSMFRSGKPVESSILKYWGIPSQALVDLTHNGEIKRVTRGLYIHTNVPVKNILTIKSSRKQYHAVYFA